MQNSLLSRFHGGIVGSIIATSGKKDGPMSQGGLLGSHFLSLISAGKLDGGEWVNLIPDEMQHWQKTLSSSETALATVPIAIFFHENSVLLTEMLAKAAAIWLGPTELGEDVIIWGKAIASALQGKSNFMTQLIADLATFSTPLREQLELVENLLVSQTGLEQARSILRSSKKESQTEIALALYCFGYTPENFGLAVLRALNTKRESMIVAALTGAIAGFYNGYSGIPVSWRLPSSTNSAQSYQMTKKLFALWSGVYFPETTELPPTIACSSPGVIQKRACLKIISQKP
ncbi:MAG: ADP-ribosylglycohydrolase family protein [Gomphosphaeria aponina SAG 52.96 = DSM 107014]|uniref:ADP-ribosylglycohydrolase family protein n=1 Tax=Gomphosphaeria aponina SAG 52.96 = DSM 107014 TaxID=1521640 RepID=A0A941GR37_9CHRO|nr:ADP-ribosylglycohydrolase family protein [Gomphosphaeria aponina SAG 52.96 = DSM 107014]